MRAHKLFDLYRSHDSWESIPAKERGLIEKTFLRCSFETEWANTRAFFLERDPVQVQKAEASPKHKLALVFRSYLGQASRWATAGEKSRSIDYQIWCGPAMGAFNQWVRGSFLEAPENRKTITLAHNILYGAAVMTRANWLRNQGAALPSRAGRVTPLSLDEIARRTSSVA
jgi:PfaD family protein